MTVSPLPSFSRISWPVFGAAAVFTSITLALIAGTMRWTGGQLVYPVDDSYIHMAVAKTLATHGSFGVTPGRFEPASSSPLWTLLVAAAFRVFGVHDSAAMWLALLAALGALFALDHVLAFTMPHPLSRAAAALAIALAIPLPALVYTGMEPALHVLLVLVLTWSVAHVIHSDRNVSPARLVGLIVLVAVSELVRFETAFVIGPLALAAALRRRTALAASLVVGAAVAVGGYSWFSLAHGGLWLPNSVLLKSEIAHLHSGAEWRDFLVRVPTRLAQRPNAHLLAVALAAFGWLAWNRRASDSAAARIRTVLVVYVVTMTLHLQLAAVGSFFRYEAYVFALGLSAVVAALFVTFRAPRTMSSRRLTFSFVATSAAVVVLAAPIVVRALRPVSRAALAGRNIFEQQVQMGRFVRDYLPGARVALNDLGAIGYFSNATVVDLAGLATTEVARARLAGTYDTAFIEELCARQQVSVALLYKSWFERFGGLPRSWYPVAQWTIRDNIIAGDDDVTIYALRTSSADTLREAVRAFQARMPSRVQVELLP